MVSCRRGEDDALPPERTSGSDQGAGGSFGSPAGSPDPRGTRAVPRESRPADVRVAGGGEGRLPGRQGRESLGPPAVGQGRTNAPPVIVLDTSAVLAFVDGKERDHGRVIAAVEADSGPYFIPTSILAEVGYLLEHRLGQRILDLFLRDIESGAFTLDCGDGDTPRIRELVARFVDLPLGFADAAVVACAERRGRRIVTLDRRDFDVVSGSAELRLLP